LACGRSSSGKTALKRYWAPSPGAYMLLRRDVDGTELDEVVLDELPGEAGA
jgi:hypothetical protein